MVCEYGVFAVVYTQTRTAKAKTDEKCSLSAIVSAERDGGAHTHTAQQKKKTRFTHRSRHSLAPCPVGMTRWCEVGGRKRWASNFRESARSHFSDVVVDAICRFYSRGRRSSRFLLEGRDEMGTFSALAYVAVCNCFALPASVCVSECVFCDREEMECFDEVWKKKSRPPKKTQNPSLKGYDEALRTALQRFVACRLYRLPRSSTVPSETSANGCRVFFFLCLQIGNG